MTLSKILIVEDEKDIQLVAEMALKDIGNMDTQIANDGREAIEILKSWTPDLIMMDVMMPNLTGPETLKILKADPKLKGIPVIFMTAKSEKEETEEYLRSGAIEVLIKPFDPMTLAQKLTDIFSNK